MPKDVNYWAGVYVVRSGVSEREVRVDRGEDSKLDYQERVVE